MSTRLDKWCAWYNVHSISFYNNGVSLSWIYIYCTIIDWDLAQVLKLRSPYRYESYLKVKLWYMSMFKLRQCSRLVDSMLVHVWVRTRVLAETRKAAIEKEGADPEFVFFRLGKIGVDIWYVDDKTIQVFVRVTKLHICSY